MINKFNDDNQGTMDALKEKASDLTHKVTETVHSTIDKIKQRIGLDSEKTENSYEKQEDEIEDSTVEPSKPSDIVDNNNLRDEKIT